METNIPAAALLAGLTPEIKYIKHVLGQIVVYAHRAQCTAGLWHHQYPKAFVHLATMQNVVFDLIDLHQEEHENFFTHFVREFKFLRASLDYMFYCQILNTSINLRSGQIIQSLARGEVSDSKLAKYELLLRKLEDRLGSRPS